ncbi:MAG: carboxypeptidase regulatory-like domain-containing protein, partial [Mariprofundaceae bacterium]|nr:carboxypeptidase regulatory-like domain-containing protein [Mariprofundaceae bacterium]
MNNEMRAQHGWDRGVGMLGMLLLLILSACGGGGGGGSSTGISTSGIASVKLQFSLPGQQTARSSSANTSHMLASARHAVLDMLIADAWAAITPVGIASVSITIANKATGIKTKTDVFNATSGQLISRTYNIPIGSVYGLVIRAFSGPLGSGTKVYQGTSTINLNNATAGAAVPTVGVQMTPVINVPPVPTAAAIATTTNTSATTQIAPNDPNTADTHSYAVTTAPLHGTASAGAAGKVGYQPATGYVGSDSFLVTVTDSGGLTGTVTIPVTVSADTVAPVITLTGALQVLVASGGSYVEQGATASDNIDGDRTASLTTSGTVNTALPGTYTISYNVSDVAGNSTTATRTVYVTRQVTGSVKDVNNNGLAGATVSFGVTINGQQKVLGSTTTGSGGSYSVGIPPATYAIKASKTGFTAATASFTLTASGSAVAPAIVLAASGAGSGGASGTVKNATNNNVLSGATISLRSGINAASSAAVVTSTTSSASGSFSFTGLTPGSYTATASKTGFANSSISVTVSGGQTSSGNAILLSPLLSAGQVRIVLSWGATPGDLDSHLVGPVSGAASGPQQFHVLYNNTGSQTVSPFAQLDTDVTSGFGPETITIAKRQTGTYRYYVHDFTNGGTSASTALTGNSSAVVKVFVGTANAPSATFNVPVTGAGDMWHVFDLNGTTSAITPVNQIAMAATEPARVIVTPTSKFVSIGNNVQTLGNSVESVDQGAIAFAGSWASSASGVVTVSTPVSPATGLLTTVAQGSADVSATESTYGYSAISKVNVVKFLVNTTTDGVDANIGDGACADANSSCSLRAAVQETNALTGADSIGLAAGIYTLTLTGPGENLSASGDLDIRDGLSIIGSGAGSTTINGNATDRVLHIDPA